MNSIPRATRCPRASGRPFSVDITLAVLKIIKLYQNKRFSQEEALDKLMQVEAIVMSAAPKGDLEELIERRSSPACPLCVLPPVSLR